MKCPKCNRDMEITEFYEDYEDDHDYMELTENHWCKYCHLGLSEHFKYKLMKEWTE